MLVLLLFTVDVKLPVLYVVLEVDKSCFIVVFCTLVEVVAVVITFVVGFVINIVVVISNDFSQFIPIKILEFYNH